MLQEEIKRRDFFDQFSKVHEKKEVRRFFLVCLQDVHVHIVDMSSARQVWEFANTFMLNNTVNVLVGTTGSKFNAPSLIDKHLLWC